MTDIPAPQAFIDALTAQLTAHEAHTWKQVGRCVYCADCGDRLYQGRLPANRKQPPTRTPEPKATTEMRERWSK